MWDCFPSVGSPRAASCQESSALRPHRVRRALSAVCNRDPESSQSPVGTGRAVASQAYLPAQPPPWPSVHSLSEKLPPLLPHQRAVLQGDRLHGAIGDCRMERKEVGCLEGTTCRRPPPPPRALSSPSNPSWSLRNHVPGGAWSPPALPSLLCSLWVLPRPSRTVFRPCSAVSPQETGWALNKRADDWPASAASQLCGLGRSVYPLSFSFLT